MPPVFYGAYNAADFNGFFLDVESMGPMSMRICFSRRRNNGNTDDADLTDLNGFSERDVDGFVQTFLSAFAAFPFDNTLGKSV